MVHRVRPIENEISKEVLHWLEGVVNQAIRTNAEEFVAVILLVLTFLWWKLLDTIVFTVCSNIVEAKDVITLNCVAIIVVVLVVAVVVASVANCNSCYNDLLLFG